MMTSRKKTMKGIRLSETAGNLPNKIERDEFERKLSHYIFSQVHMSLDERVNLRAKIYNSDLSFEVKKRLLRFEIEELKVILKQSPHPSPLEVPVLGERILSYMCSPSQLEGMLGDLEENFRRQAEKRGVRVAKRWYY